KPVIGRFYTAEEDRAPIGTKVAVLSYGYWQAQYGASREVLGRPITIGPSVYTIIGVAPAGFSGMSLEAPVVFVPITAAAPEMFGGMTDQSYAMTYGISWMEMFVRRRPGVSVQTATADLTMAYKRSYAAQLVEQ